MKKNRKFQVTLHIFDTDGHKRGLQGMVFTSKGDQSDLSKVIFGFGNEFVTTYAKSIRTLRLIWLTAMRRFAHED